MRLVSLAAALLTGIAGTGTLVGWATGIPWLQSLVPSPIAMCPNAALAFVLGALALGCLGPEAGRGWRRLGQAGAFAAALIGLLTLGEYVFGANLGIDLLLVPPASHAVWHFAPGRMPPLAAVCFVLLGTALLVVDVQGRRGLRPTEWLSFPAAVISVMALLEHLFGLHSYLGPGTLTSLPLYSGIAFTVLSAGVLSARPDRGLMAVATAETEGGKMWRRLLPVAILLPAALAWLRLQGQLAGYYGTEVGLDLMAVAMIALLAVVVWVYAQSLDHSDRQRRRNESRFRGLLNVGPHADLVIDGSGTIALANEVASRLFGYPLEELVGQPIEMLVPARFREEHARKRAAYLAAPRPRAMGNGAELWALRKGGSEFPAEIVLGPLESEGEALIGCHVLDLSERKRVENRLRAASRYARSLIEASLDPLVTISPEGQITDVNRATEEATGLSRDELIGTDFSTYFTEPEEARRGYRQAFEQGTVRDFPLALRHRDGRVSDVLYNAATYQGAGGEVEGLFAAARDVTARKDAEDRLRAASRYARNLIEASLDPLVTISPEGTVTDVNRATEEATGLSRDELIGTDFSTYFTEPDKAREGYQKAFEQGTVRDYPLALRHKSGRITDVLYNAATYQGAAGAVEGLFAAARDVTARKQAENELRRSNQDLEQFAYAASHDLQEPLRMVASYTQLLGDRYRGKLDADADDFIGFAVDGAKRMQRLIEDLLAYSRVGTRGREAAPCQAGALVATALRNLEVAVAESGARIEVGELPEIRGDAIQLAMVFQNLIANAIKFRDRHRPCEIRVSARAQGGEWIFSVEDNGIGIEPRHFDRIFQVFQRLHTREEYPGTGIGLAISKKIVERHHGRLWVESRPGAGSCFRFSVPKGVPREENDVRNVDGTH